MEHLEPLPAQEIYNRGEGISYFKSIGFLGAFTYHTLKLPPNPGGFVISLAPRIIHRAKQNQVKYLTKAIQSQLLCRGYQMATILQRVLNGDYFTDGFHKSYRWIQEYYDRTPACFLFLFGSVQSCTSEHMFQFHSWRFQSFKYVRVW